MWNRIGENVSKYKHIIILGVAIAAVRSYFLPINAFVFAAHNGNPALSSRFSASTPQTPLALHKLQLALHKLQLALHKLH